MYGTVFPHIRLGVSDFLFVSHFKNFAHVITICLMTMMYNPRVGPGHPLSPLVHLLPHLFPFFFSLSFIPEIVPLRFQAGGRRERPNLGLVCCVCVICIP